MRFAVKLYHIESAISRVFYDFFDLFGKIYAVGYFFEYGSAVIGTRSTALFHDYCNILRLVGGKTSAEPRVAYFITVFVKNACLRRCCFACGGEMFGTGRGGITVFNDRGEHFQQDTT